MASEEPSDSELLAVMQASIDADALTDVSYEHAHQSLYLIRKRMFERSEELARLRTALESAQADRQRAVDDLFEQLRENARLRAESMRGAVTAILREAEVRESSDEDDPDPWKMVADWLEQQLASQWQPLENIEGLTQAQPVCRASQTAMMRAELATKAKPAKPEKEKP